MLLKIMMSAATFMWTMLLFVFLVASLTFVQFIMWDFLLQGDDSDERYWQRHNTDITKHRGTCGKLRCAR
jgi:hypothetical protein